MNDAEKYEPGISSVRVKDVVHLSALSVGNQAAKVKMTMLVSTSDFMIISKKKLNIKGARKFFQC